MARKPKKPKLTWDQEQRIRLSAVLRPAAQRALTREEAYKLIYESARSLRQGLSLHGGGIEQVLDEVFVPPANIDFRSLLLRYMTHVSEREGDMFLDETAVSGQLFTADEMTALREIRAEAIDIYWPNGAPP